MKTKCCNADTRDEEIMVECCAECDMQEPEMIDDTPVTVTKEWLKRGLQLAYNEWHREQMRIGCNGIEKLPITEHFDQVKHLL